MKSEIKTTTVESLLGVLSLKPMSGYEMRQFMEQSTANFWSESFGQIYPALKRMVAEGLVEVEEQSGEGHPAKKVYRITEAGEGRLREWLAAAVRPQVKREELLLKVFFGDRAERGVIARQVMESRERYVEEIRGYEEMMPEMEREYAAHPAMPFWRMTLRCGITEAKAMLTWCEETLRELAEMEKQGLGIRD